MSIMKNENTVKQLYTANMVWVLGEAKPSGELANTTYELSAKAAELADSLSSSTKRPHKVVVMLLLDSKVENSARLEATAKYGADEVMVISGDRLPLDRAACGRILAYLAAERKPHIILASATAFGRSVMPYTAALLKTGLTADCTGLSIEPETNLLLQTRPAIGGNIMATIKTPNHRPQMATVRPKTFRIPEPIEGRSIKVTEPAIPEELMRPTLKTLEFKKFKVEDGTLQEREIVVSGGKGLRKAEGFALIGSLADILGAGIGASRPVVEMKWINYPHQVGLSGQVISPKVYIAVGISGTVQHLAGMQTSGKIISINRDPDALIFNVSDVAIIGDLYEIIPRLIEKIRERKETAR
jgi:electron transfer flavoprotein alpha subunit